MAEGVRLRPALPAERRLLEALQTRASLGNAGDRAALLRHPDAIDIPLEQLERGQVSVAESDGAIVGFVAVVPRDDGNAELDALFVEPVRWRRGIGRALLTHAVGIARANGAEALHVVGNPHAEAFYRANGFETTGTFKTRFGPGLLMRRLLPPG